MAEWGNQKLYAHKMPRPVANSRKVQQKANAAHICYEINHYFRWVAKYIDQVIYVRACYTFLFVQFCPSLEWKVTE